MRNETLDKAEPAVRKASAVGRIVMLFLHWLGIPGAWLILLFAMLVAEIGIKGIDFTVEYFGILMAYFLSRIARAVEKIAGI